MVLRILALLFVVSCRARGDDATTQSDDDVGPVDTGPSSPVDTNTPVDTSDTGVPADGCGTMIQTAIVDDTQLFDDLESAFAAATVTVTICPGIYVGTFVGAVPLHIAGEAGAAATVLDGAGAQRVLSVVGGSTVEGVTVRGGVADRGAGIELVDEGAAYTIRNSVISDNVAVEDGGGLWIAPQSMVDLPGTTILTNDAYRGGGLYAGPQTTLDLTTATLSDNTATEGGGGYVGDRGVLTGGTMSANVAARGGGLYLNVELTADGMTIQGNEAETGGGVFIEGRMPEEVYAGYLYPARTATLIDVTVLGNVSTGVGKDSSGGGGIYALSVDLVLDGTTSIEGNVAVEQGGGVFLTFGSLTGGELTQNSAGSGGGATFIRADGTDITVRNNSAVSGGGIEFAHGGNLGGLVIEDNDASLAGGGLSVVDQRVAADADEFGYWPGWVSLLDSEIRRNVAGVNGGGMSILQTLFWHVDVGDCVFEDNAAAFGGGVFADRLAPEPVDADTSFTDSFFLRNVATVAGGGIWYGGLALTSNTSDWGDGLDDNAPDDVALPDVTYVGYAVDASFDCNQKVCDPLP